jgi:plastocyanin
VSTATTAASTTAPSEPAVTVKQFQFMTPGTADGKFDDPMDGVGQSFTFTFNQAGSFPYFCSRHNSMTGTLVVQ